MSAINAIYNDFITGVKSEFNKQYPSLEGKEFKIIAADLKEHATAGHTKVDSKWRNYIDASAKVEEIKDAKKNTVALKYKLTKKYPISRKTYKLKDLVAKWKEGKIRITFTISTEWQVIFVNFVEDVSVEGAEMTEYVYEDVDPAKAVEKRISPYAWTSPSPATEVESFKKAGPFHMRIGRAFTNHFGWFGKNGSQKEFDEKTEMYIDELVENSELPLRQNYTDDVFESDAEGVAVAEMVEGVAAVKISEVPKANGGAGKGP